MKRPHSSSGKVKVLRIKVFILRIISFGDTVASIPPAKGICIATRLPPGMRVISITGGLDPVVTAVAGSGDTRRPRGT